MELLAKLSSLLWTPWLLALFLLTGGLFSLRSGFFQLFGWKLWLRDAVRGLLRPTRTAGGGLSPFQAMATALGSTVGTGSIAGVASAIWFGGPGAVFWMWISALLGMMTGYAEKYLSIRFRKRTPAGSWEGGPLEYISIGLGLPGLARLFAVACAAAALIGGNLVQSNSIAAALHTAFSWDRFLVGIVTAAVTALVIFGGVSRIGTVSQALVPGMAVLFLAGGVWTLWICRAALIPALRQIVLCALCPRAAAGGAGGYALASAMRYGVARGVFTNEAGMGSSAMAHGASDSAGPVEQGKLGILEVFLATVVIATVSALVILASGVYDPAAALTSLQTGGTSSDLAGVPLAVRAFTVGLGRSAGPFLAVCLLLFAFSSLLGWSYYGQRCVCALTPSPAVRRGYRLAFVLLIAAGGVLGTGCVWELADLCNGLMALPNLAALLLLSRTVSYPPT